MKKILLAILAAHLGLATISVMSIGLVALAMMPMYLASLSRNMWWLLSLYLFWPLTALWLIFVCPIGFRIIRWSSDKLWCDDV